MNFKFTCEECGTTFTMKPERLIERTSVQCPTCNLLVSDSIFTELKSMAKLIEKIKNAQPSKKERENKGSVNTKLLIVEFTTECL